MSVRIQTGDTEPIQVFVRAVSNGAPLPGKSDLYVRVMRETDGQFLDWNDMTFKAAGWTTLNQLLSEVDGTNAPGLYEVSGGLDTSAITNLPADANLVVVALQTPGTDALLPDPAEIKVGQWVDEVGKVDSSPVAWPPAAGSLIDLLTNKDGSMTYDQSTDSLEAIKDRIG